MEETILAVLLRVVEDVVVVRVMGEVEGEGERKKVEQARRQATRARKMDVVWREPRLGEEA